MALEAAFASARDGLEAALEVGFGDILMAA
jgi:hypothetical protein